MGTGTGIMIASPRVEGSTVTGNTITGSGAHAIYVASPAKPNPGKHVIYGNTVPGYCSKLFIDLALHPRRCSGGQGIAGYDLVLSAPASTTGELPDAESRYPNSRGCSR